MRIPEHKIREIKKRWDRIQTNADLLDLLNFAKSILYKKRYHPFEIKQLTYHSFQNLNPHRYNFFYVKKKNGGDRTILAPNKGLKLIQKCLNLVFRAIYIPSKQATGFTQGKSIVDNAGVHTNQKYILSIDLKDFFSSIEQRRIWGRLQHPPFNLNKKEGRLHLANLISSLCCHPLVVDWFDPVNNQWTSRELNVLPQGAPTSPLLSNAICQRLDFVLNAVAKRFRLKYSRYADDLTFSAMEKVFTPSGEVMQEIRRVIAQEGFTINEEKVRIQGQAYRQEVTGLVVNEKVNVRSSDIADIKMWLYFWERYGLARAQVFFEEKEMAPYSQNAKTKNLRNVIQGRLNHITFVKGAEHPTCKKLNARFEKLTSTLPLGELNKRSQKSSSEKKRPHVAHPPSEIAKALLRFSSNGSGLKRATHRWDPNPEDSDFQSIDTFLSTLQKDRKILDLLEKYDPKLKNLIYAFLYAENGAGRNPNKKTINQAEEPQETYWLAKNERVSITWRSKELSDWCNANPTKSPFDFPIIPQTKIHGKRVARFSDIVALFKEEIEVRSGSNSLDQLINDAVEVNLMDQDFKVHIDSRIKSLQFFTHVKRLRTGLRYLFAPFADRTEHKRITCSLQEISEHSFSINILHNGSNCLYKVEEFSRRLDRGDLGEAIDSLRNLCDWAVEAKFADGTFRVNMLRYGDEDVFNEIGKADGFKHILTFYN